MNKSMIYADHAATTALSPTAYEAMLPWLQDKFGNPSTLYSLARDPRKAVAQAREIVAAAINANPSEIFFTSGGTEADNWALKGAAFQHERGKGIITSAIEHHAILNSSIALERMGYHIDTLQVDQEGVVQADTLRSALSNNTAFVSVMLANNEIGTIEPIAELAQLTHQAGVLFHTDAVQAVGHIPVDVKRLQVDMLSASAHKSMVLKVSAFFTSVRALISFLCWMVVAKSMACAPVPRMLLASSAWPLRFKSMWST